MRVLVLAAVTLFVLLACHEPVAPMPRQPGLLASFVPADEITITTLGHIADETRDLWINDQGQVLSLFDGSGPCGENLAQSWQGGTWTPVSTALCATTYVKISPIDLNNRGQILAEEENDGTVPYQVRYFLWNAGAVTYLNLPPASYPAALNDVGQIVGTFFPKGFIGPYFTPNDTAHVFVWDNGAFTDLGADVYQWDNANFTDLGLRNVTIRRMNNAEQIIGQRVTFNNEIPQQTNQQTFFWDIPRGRFVLMPGAIDLNNSGVVVAAGILWNSTTGVFTSMSIAPSNARRSINDLGQVAGSELCGQSLCAAETPAVWQGGTLTGLPTLSEDDQSDCQALSINNLGQVAGICPNSFWPVIWNTLQPASPAQEAAILTSSVNALLADGTLNASQAKNLIKKLNSAIGVLPDTAAAIKAFRQFINQVTSLWQLDGVLTAAQAQPLIDAAQHAIDELMA